jgi:cytochrome P450
MLAHFLSTGAAAKIGALAFPARRSEESDMADTAATVGSSAGEIFGAILAPAGKADPYPLYAALHELGEAAEVMPGLIVAVSYASVNAMLRDPTYLVADAARLDQVSKGWREHPSLEADSLLSMNGAAHARVRSAVAGAFTARRVSQLTTAVERIADQLIAAMAERCAAGSAVDFMAEFAYQLPVTVICELLGVPEADRAAFRPVARDLVVALEPIEDPAELAAADAAAIWLADYFTELVAARRAEPRDDLVSALVEAVDSAADGEAVPALTETELLSNLTLLLVAGFETTTNLLGNGLRVILTRPDVESSLRDGAVTAEAFVAEVLRYDAPVQATSRWRPDLGEVAGVPVRPGWQVIALLGAANRDPRRFASPDSFDPARPDGGALSFGAGAHFCVGAALARMEATVAFPRLLASFPKLVAAGDPVRRNGLVLRGFDQLPVSLC